MSKQCAVLTILFSVVGMGAGYVSHARAGFLRPVFQQEPAPEPPDCHLRNTTILHVVQGQEPTVTLNSFTCVGPCRDPKQPPCKREPASVPQKGAVKDIHCKCKDEVLRNTECQMTADFEDGFGPDRVARIECSNVGCTGRQICTFGQIVERHADPDAKVTVVIIKTFCFCLGRP